jgi:hypothetical protein
LTIFRRFFDDSWRFSTIFRPFLSKTGNFYSNVLFTNVSVESRQYFYDKHIFERWSCIFYHFLIVCRYHGASVSTFAPMQQNTVNLW